MVSLCTSDLVLSMCDIFTIDWNKLALKNGAGGWLSVIAGQIAELGPVLYCGRKQSPWLL